MISFIVIVSMYILFFFSLSCPFRNVRRVRWKLFFLSFTTRESFPIPAGRTLNEQFFCISMEDIFLIQKYRIVLKHSRILENDSGHTICLCAEVSNKAKVTEFFSRSTSFLFFYFYIKINLMRPMNKYKSPNNR